MTEQATQVVDIHGTYAGWNWHQRNGIPPCEPCKKAATDYQRERRQNNPVIRSKTNAEGRAISRALWRLANIYSAEFGRLKADEMRTERDRGQL